MSSSYRDLLTDTLRTNQQLWQALHRLPALELPDWYLGAGCIAQTVWNLLHERPPAEGILDYDLVYFEGDLSEEAEQHVRDRANAALSDLNLNLDVKNQARVHLWYAGRFGYEIPPYTSTEDAIATWPTTSNAIGVRCTTAGGLEVCAPFGLDDLFNLVVRPNRRQVTREIYEAKARRWKKQWPKLFVLPWDSQNRSVLSG